MRFARSAWSPLVVGLVAFLHWVVVGQDRGSQQSQPEPKPAFSCLLIDLEEEGLSLSAAADGVVFDIDGDGVSERVAWPKPGSRLGFLAMDVSDNGLIDSGAELVGLSFRHPSVTKASSAYMITLLLQGVSVGADLKPYGSDGKPLMQSPTIGRSPHLEPDDAAFQRLRLWRDADRDGRSSPSELTRLDAHRILAVSSAAQPLQREVPGALVRFEGNVRLAGEAVRRTYEVVLERNPTRR